MATTKKVKHICDRCGNSEERSVLHMDTWYPTKWQHVTLGQTGAQLDLCENCNLVLADWLQQEGATNMLDACVNKRETL